MQSNTVTRTLGKKVNLGMFRFPIWAVGLAAMGIAAVAGQAVGPVLDGAITGSAGLTVRQTVLLDNGQKPTTAGTDDSAVVMNDERTEFTAAMLLKVGQLTALCIYLENDSGKLANAVLELSVPMGIDVELSEFDDGTADSNSDLSADDGANTCATGAMTPGNSSADDAITDEAHLNAKKWVVKVASASDPVGAPEAGAGHGNDDGIRILIEPKDDLAPGYYIIKGRLVQTAS